jgi:hypothetical protein
VTADSAHRNLLTPGDTTTAEELHEVGVASFIERPQDPTARVGYSRLMAWPFDWIEDSRTRPRPLPSEPNWRKVILVLVAIAIVVALALAVGEPIR